MIAATFSNLTVSLAVGRYAKDDEVLPASTDRLILALRIDNPSKPQTVMRLLILVFSLVTASGDSAIGQDRFELDVRSVPVPQPLEARFRLVPTTNIWTHLLLDSSNGKVWQVQYSVQDTLPRFRAPINSRSLTPPTGARPGRFTLYSTQNMWTFLLVDQDDGRLWQVQWSTDGNRGLWAIEP